MKVLVFDNYDSFTYNLVHMVENILHQKTDVFRNDQLPLEKVKDYDKIILSPGPGLPSEAGLLLPLIKEYASTKSILGVCLGHQAIGETFGAGLVTHYTVYHGVSTKIFYSDHKNENGQKLGSVYPSQLFKDLPAEMEVGRYHSWIVDEINFPSELEVTARDENNYIMALQHKQFDLQGVQFHPESVLTPLGEQVLRNWLNQ